VWLEVKVRAVLVCPLAFGEQAILRRVLDAQMHQHDVEQMLNTLSTSGELGGSLDIA
jgi:hypothetical protein